MASILIVEDDKHQRLLLKEELAEEGYSVTTAASGKEALARVAEAMPDLGELRSTVRHVLAEHRSTAADASGAQGTC